MSEKNTTKQSAEPNDGQPKNSEQFDRFEQLTRRLLAVPKQEADKQRAKKNRKKDR